MSEIKKSLFDYVSAPAPRYILRLSVLNKIFQNLDLPSSVRFLEIGPGRGDVSHYLIDQQFISEGNVIDFSEEAIVFLGERLGHYSNLSILQGEFDSFDLSDLNLVCAFEVLEHIEKDQDFLISCAAMLDAGGYFLMSVPAYQCKWQRQDEWAGHVRRYEKNELYEKLINAGFEVEYLIDYGFPLMNALMPIKEIYYRHIKRGGGGLNLIDKTKYSGVDRSLFGGLNIKVCLWFYYPFIWLQKLFLNNEKGDGLIAIARKL